MSLRAILARLTPSTPAMVIAPILEPAIRKAIAFMILRITGFRSAFADLVCNDPNALNDIKVSATGSMRWGKWQERIDNFVRSEALELGVVLTTTSARYYPARRIEFRFDELTQEWLITIGYQKFRMVDGSRLVVTLRANASGRPDFTRTVKGATLQAGEARIAITVKDDLDLEVASVDGRNRRSVLSRPGRTGVRATLDGLKSVALDPCTCCRHDCRIVHSFSALFRTTRRTDMLARHLGQAVYGLLNADGQPLMNEFIRSAYFALYKNVPVGHWRYPLRLRFRDNVLVKPTTIVKEARVEE